MVQADSCLKPRLFTFYNPHVSLQTTRNTCSRRLSRWMLRRTAGRMWPSTPKAQWLTSFTGWKSRTTWRMSWPMLPAWSPTRTALLTPTATPQAGVRPLHQAFCLACSASSGYSDDPLTHTRTEILCMYTAMQTLSTYTHKHFTYTGWQFRMQGRTNAVSN